MTCRLVSVVLAMQLVATAPACDSSDEACTGPEILPHLSPVNLGNFFPLGQGETPDPGSPEKVPYEVTLFLRNTCQKPLVIEAACIVGDAHNGDEDDPAFTIEGPVPKTVASGDVAAVRLTYDSDKFNKDLDDDKTRDPDQIAVVIQSNAKNFPTLVVPVCAMIIPNDEEPVAFVCESPLTVPAGKTDASYCR